mmetsp:Transcript_21185/g.39830  ORF Transcript_21185/g.39830 Transcript_21185/m.39830 type:complete len:157 (+) Transcript_21185:127-597(+)
MTKTRLMPEFALEAVPKNHRSRLAWCGEIPEQQLNGNVPAIVGEDAFCWIEVCREPDVIEKGKARFNEDDDDIAPPPKEEKQEVRRRPAPAPSGGAAKSQPAREPAQSTSCSQEHRDASEVKDEEPTWPLYVGLGVLVVLMIFFCQMTWDDKTQVL